MPRSLLKYAAAFAAGVLATAAALYAYAGRPEPLPTTCEGLANEQGVLNLVCRYGCNRKDAERYSAVLDGVHQCQVDAARAEKREQAERSAAYARAHPNDTVAQTVAADDAEAAK